MATHPLPCVVSYGMGTDSTGMLVRMAREGWRPDVIQFADTGSEQPRTYAYLPTIREWLSSVDFPDLEIVKHIAPKVGDQSLYDECYRKSVLPSMAYGRHSCAEKWKIEPQERADKLRYGWNFRAHKWEQPKGIDAEPGHWAHGPYVLRLIGYDAGPRDKARSSNGKASKGYIKRFPLIEWGMNRAACEREILAAGLPLPGKSSCFMCPASKKRELDTLALEHPELAAKAIELESRAIARGTLRTVQGLGRKFTWTQYWIDNPTPGADCAIDFLSTDESLEEAAE